MEAAAAMVERPNQLGWVVAPTYELSEKIFREVFWAFHKYLADFVENSSLSRQGMHIKLVNGSQLIGKSADNPTSLIGEGLNFLIIDEASRVKSDVWFEALRPTLTDKKGWAIFISTPRGKNWFYDLYMMGITDCTDYCSWKFSSYNNPYLDDEEIEQAKLRIPKATFLQEYMAEFLESADGYFTSALIESCCSDDITWLDKRQHVKQQFSLGVDCARMGEDESVLMVLKHSDLTDAEHRVVYIESWKTNTTVQLAARIKFLNNQFHFQQMFIDMTGLGAGVYDILDEAIPGCVVGVTFTIKTKQDIYSNLKVLMENKQLLIPKHRKLVEQLKDLRYTTTASGDLKLHHSDNGFDDFCDALALACYSVRVGETYSPILA